MIVRLKKNEIIVFYISSSLRQAAIRNKNQKKDNRKRKSRGGEKKLWRGQSWQKENDGEEGGRGVTQAEKDE